MIFENDKVLVLDVTVAPHTRTHTRAIAGEAFLYVTEAGNYFDYGADERFCSIPVR